MRPFFACVAAAAVAAAGALVLGEYSYGGVVVLGSGLVLGLLVGEAAVAAARRGGTGLAVVCAGLAGAGMLWGAWISTGRDLAALGPAGWLAVVVAGAAGAVRAGEPVRRLSAVRSRRAAGNPAPAPAPGVGRDESPG